MSFLFLTRDEVRRLDRQAIDDLGMAGAVLMENAGRGAAELLKGLGIHGKVMICCGKGNNGGDGFVMARHLANWNVPVQVLLFARPQELTGDAAVNYHVIARAGLSVIVYADRAVAEAELSRQFATAEWIVDALFGTGLTRPVRPPFDTIIRSMNAAHARILAVDIPSGLDCDTGEPTEPTVRAEHTVTFAALKKGFANRQAEAWFGQVHLVDIGVPRVLLNSAKGGVPT